MTHRNDRYGNPPKNFWEFYYHLKAASENNNKPLAGLQHAVYVTPQSTAGVFCCISRED